MKYILPLILLIMLVVSSCRKTYTCKCDGSILHLEAQTKFMTKKKADKWCESLQDGATPTCELK